MSQKPYIFQEDSPNLVIVPTDNIDTFYEPLPKKLKEDDTPPVPKPTPVISHSVFARKTSAKLNFSGRNNDVLIDVHKVQNSPTSWASNFLHSIGGASTKYDRIYSLAPKPTSLLKHSTTQPENNTLTTLSHPNYHQNQTNIESASQTIDKKTSQPKININLIDPKPAPQHIMPKEATKLKSNTGTNTSIRPTLVRKEPSLPKNYKIPMQSKPKKTLASITEKETTKPKKGINSTSFQTIVASKNQTLIPSSKKNYETVNSSQNKIPITHITKNKETGEPNKEPSQLNHDLKNSQNRNSQVKAHIKTNKNSELHNYGDGIQQHKANKIKVQQINKQNTTCDEVFIRPIYKVPAQPVVNKENNQPKHNKEIKQSKAIRESALQRDYKDLYPKSDTKENISITTDEDIIAHIKSIKDKYKKNKQEPNFSTKLKTKKEHVSIISNKVTTTVKRSKSKDNQSKEIRSNKHTDKLVANKKSPFPQTLLTKEDIITKLKKKRGTEKKSAQVNNQSNKTKRIKLSAPDTNKPKHNTSKLSKDDRLSKSISPVKSVVSIIKADHKFHNSEKHDHKESVHSHSHHDIKSNKIIDFHGLNSEKLLQRGSRIDLRTKLKRKNPSNDYQKEDYKWSHINKRDKFATVPNGERFVPEDNLIISFNAENDSEEKLAMNKSPVKKLARKQPSPKNKKCKKIKLEINIVFGHGDTTDEESTKSEVETHVDTMENMDLSFLDDFDVDEIAESLNECKDSTKKSRDKEDNLVDVNVKDTILEENKTMETMVDKSSVIFNANQSLSEEISSIENKIENHQGTGLSSTANRHFHEETESTIDLNICTRMDNTSIQQSANKTEVIHNVRVSPSEVPKSNTSLDHTTNDNKILAPTPRNELKGNFNTILENNTEEHNNTLPLLTKVDHPVITKCTKNDNRVHPPETPKVMSSSENYIYSDHNDLIDALQDNSDLEINAIKSYIASLNKSNNETQPQTTTRYSNTHEKTCTHHVTEILTCIKEDPDVILIDDSDSENETKQSVKNKNAEDMQPGKESLSDKSNEVTVIKPSEGKVGSILTLHTNTDYFPPAKESLSGKSDEATVNESSEDNSDSTLILDSNEDDLQPSEENLFNKSGEVTSIVPSKEDSNSKLDTNAECIQPDKESQLDKSNAVMIIESNVENSESVLVLDTDYDIDDSDNTSMISEIQQNCFSKNTILAESNPDKTAPNDTSMEVKTNVSPEINSEREKTLVRNQMTHEKCGTTKTEIDHKNDLPDTAKVASKPDLNTSNESFSKKTPTKEVSEKCTPKTVEVNKQPPNTKHVTKTHSKAHCETHNENKEAAKNSEEKAVESFVNTKFVQKLESELFVNMGKKITVRHVIRDGKFSQMFHCKDSLVRDYAVKTLKKQCDGFNRGIRKQNMMLDLQRGVPQNNLNCVRYIKGFLASGLWCFVMEYFPMNLQQAFAANKRSFHIDDVQILSRQLVSAVTILRNNSIIHSDIKPSHILINSSQTRIKLCGFDQASYMKDIVLLPNTGTVNYRAPELILGYPAGYGIDVWSTALVMYEMATNRKLFPGYYNNNILHQQLCTLGAIPVEMLMGSQFRNTHFRGMAFLKKIGNKEKIIINEIEFNGRLNATLFRAYTTDWGKEKQASKRDDKAKLRAFSDLVHSMLDMHPRCRIAIEFVFANPFIYESFDDCID